jgi:hypothetical protein
MNVEDLKKCLLVSSVLLFSSLSTISCTKSPVSGSFEIYSYPVAAGNRWKYSRILMYSNFRPTQPGATFPLDTLQNESRVFVAGREALSNGLNAWRFSQVDTGTTGRFAGEQYYIISGDTMWLVAYRGGTWQSLPRGISRVVYSFHGNTFSSPVEITDYLQGILSVLRSDSIVLLNPPRPTLTFPLRVGRRWQYTQEFFRLDKQVIGYENVSFAGQTAWAAKVQWIYQGGLMGIEFTDYFTSQGLMKRRIFIKDIAITTEEYPEGIGLVDITDETVIASVSVN